MITKQDVKFRCRRYVLNHNKELDYNKSDYLTGEGWATTYTLDVVDGDTTGAIVKRLFNINGDTFNTKRHGRYVVVRDCYRVDLDQFYYDADTDTYFYNLWVADGFNKDYILDWESQYLKENKEVLNKFKKEHAYRRAKVLSRLKDLYGHDYSKTHHAYTKINNNEIISTYDHKIKVITTLDDNWYCQTTYQYQGNDYTNFTDLQAAFKNN